MLEYRCCRGCGLVLQIEEGSMVTHMAYSRIINGRRLCKKCADEAEHMREMGYDPSKRTTLHGMIEEMAERSENEEAKRMRRLEELPVVRHDEYTFFTDLGRVGAINPGRSVDIVMTHALASADVNRWLDTLNDPEASDSEKEEALAKLHKNRAEYEWICVERERLDKQLKKSGIR